MKNILLITLAATCFASGIANAGNILIPDSTGKSLGTLYSVFHTDNTSTYQCYIQLHENGTWNFDTRFNNALSLLNEVMPFSGNDIFNLNTSTLHLDSVSIGGFDYTVDLLFSGSNWKLVLGHEITLDLTGTWTGSYYGKQITYSVLQQGSTITITNPDTGQKFSGTTNGHTANFTENDGKAKSSTTVTLSSSKLGTMTVISCTPPPGYSCQPPVGSTITIHR